MNNCTCVYPTDNNTFIVTLVGIILTFGVSTLDLLINAYIGVKKRHLVSSCGMCSCIYDSEKEDK